MTKTVIPLVFVGTLACLDCAVAQKPGALLWKYTVSDGITSSVALASDGTLYLGSGNGLHAITNAGSNKWTFAASVVHSPAVASDGAIYFGDRQGNLHALDPDGTEKWVYPVGAEVGSDAFLSTPAIGSDQSLYCCVGRYLCAFAADGTKKWIVAFSEFSSEAALSPTIGPDGTIYIGASYEQTICAFKPDGTLKWQCVLRSQGGIGESPVIGADGTIYISAWGLCAVSPSGSKLWEAPAYQKIGGSAVIGNDGTLYVGSLDGTDVWALTPGGQTKWHAVAVSVFHAPAVTVPAIDAAGRIYYCNSNAVWALNPQGVTEWVFAPVIGQQNQPTMISPTIGPDGTIYASFFATLYALCGGSPPGDTPCPMYRQNWRHTGKREKPMLKEPQKRSDSGFEFQLYPNELGRTYQIDFSTNLDTWTSLTSFVAATLPTPVVDSDASNAPARFYRAFAP